jgi:uncharacterized HAD superfamily protein
MAKTGGMDVLIWEIFRGTGRQTGRSISKTITKEISKHTIDDSSKYRKAMEKFEITASLNTTLNKFYKIIDLFEEEYSTTKAVFQSKWYLKDDIALIEKKLKHAQRLVITDANERAYERCTEFWLDIKEQIIKK